MNQLPLGVSLQALRSDTLRVGRKKQKGAPAMLLSRVNVNS
jgi:hypothetical protein